MSAIRIGAALRRELPALDELRSGEGALPGAEGPELALLAPSPTRRSEVASGRPASPPAPSARALGSLVAATGRLAEPGALASLGEAAGPVKAMLEAVEELLAMGRSVEHARKMGVRA